jgi:hypothetical protein
MLRGAPSLRSLSLRNNTLTDRGVGALVAALDERVTEGGLAPLELLDLQGCEVGPRGLRLLKLFTSEAPEAAPRRLNLQKQLSAAGAPPISVEYAAGRGWSDDRGADEKELSAAERDGDPFGWEAR